MLRSKLVFWQIELLIFIMPLFIIVIACDSAEVFFSSLLYFLFWLFGFYNINFDSQNKAFLGSSILLMIAIMAILLFFFLRYISLKRLRLKSSQHCFLSQKLRFFISGIFFKIKLSFFRLKLSFLEEMLIDILGICMSPESHLSPNMFLLFWPVLSNCQTRICTTLFCSI